MLNFENDRFNRQNPQNGYRRLRTRRFTHLSANRASLHNRIRISNLP